jgi:hypothetical protein
MRLLPGICGIVLGLVGFAAQATTVDHHDHSEVHFDYISGSAQDAANIEAAEITTQEAALDAIFSQAGFTSPIDIRFNSTLTLTTTTLHDVDTQAKSLELLFGTLPFTTPSNEIFIFYVDSISACGSTIGNSNIVGCAATPGNRIYVQSSTAAGSRGAELLGHELGHNLGLGHRSGGLMNSSLNGQVTMNSTEIAIVENSSLRQFDGQDFFFEITPVLVEFQTAVPVPLPATGLLLIGAIGAGVVTRKRRR